MSLAELKSGEIKSVKEFIDEIPLKKLMPSGSSGTCYPPTKDQEVGGWRLDEQGFTTKKLAYNMQIQKNTKGGVRGASVIMIHLSCHGVMHGTITENLIRQALHAAVDAEPRKIYVTHDGKCITDLEAFKTGEEEVAPEEEKKGRKKKCEWFLARL